VLAFNVKQDCNNAFVVLILPNLVRAQAAAIGRHMGVKNF
jgi:hypothetical protein